MRRTVSTAFIGLALVFMPAAPAAAQGVTIRGLLGAGLSFLHISDCSGECIVMAEGETENAQRFWFGISIPLGR